MIKLKPFDLDEWEKTNCQVFCRNGGKVNKLLYVPSIYLKPLIGVIPGTYPTSWPSNDSGEPSYGIGLWLKNGSYLSENFISQYDLMLYDNL